MIALGSCCLCLAGQGFFLPVDFLLNLTFGWAVFLYRVAPQVTVSWTGVLTAALCLLGLTFGLQQFLRWVRAAVRRPTEGDGPPPAPWQFRWTAAILGVVVLMFVAGVAAVGISHQTAWLLTSPEPLVEGGMRRTIGRIESANKLRQIGIAANSHHESFGHFPPGGTFDSQGRMLHGWQTFLLPYLERDYLYERIDLKLPWNHPANTEVCQTILPCYQYDYGTPEQKDAAGFALSHYAGNVRVLGGDVPLAIKDIPDGTANTILAGEAAGNYKPWGYPANWRDPALGLNTTPDDFGNPRRGPVNFAFADGSVRSLDANISPEVLKALSTPAGGEKLPESY
jgi:prepilin-type processing-associated H-X9-DG protein